MKYFHWFKGLIFIALACTFTARGSAFINGVSKNDQQHETLSVYKVNVSAGQSGSTEASANLSIAGENSKVSVSKEGTVSVVASKSIVFGPGTKVISGGFLYATIESKSKSGKLLQKEIRVVTVEEKMKIEEQECLSTAYALFSPFPTRNKGRLHAGDAEEGSYTSSNNVLSAVSPEQQRKVGINGCMLAEVSHKQTLINYSPSPVSHAYRPESMRVLRL